MKWTESSRVKLSNYMWELKSQPEKEKKEYQPWKNTELSNLWVEMCEAENDWLSCQHGSRKCLLNSVYVQTLKRFDKSKTKQK